MPSPLARPAATVRRRGGALLAAVAVLVSLLVALAGPAAADPTPPPNPSDAQIGAAQASKTELATQVGDLTAQLSQLAREVEELDAAAELAEQDYAYAAQQLADATAAATTAKADVVTAQAAVETARTAFNASVRANYTQGGVQGGAGALLSSDDPNQVLQSAALQAYVTDHQVDGIGQLDRATVAKANADARARTAVATQTQLTAAAETALADARAAESAAQQKQSSVATETTAVQAQLDTAQATLLGLQDQRAAYDAWKAEQARIAAEAERQRQAALVAQQQAAAKALAAQQAAQAPSGSSGRSSSGSSGGSSGGQSSGNPSGGSWSAAKGQDAVNRAMKWIDTKYSFDGGGYAGPSLGYCSNDAGWNDCHIVGFDCSGLMMYGWAPYIHLTHKASIQYYQAGDYHPSVGDLQPGDMLFYGGSAATIHHVAMYIGNGNVVQAPHSGDVVKTTSIYQMGSDYYGATRPLT